ncbi:MAG: hypothetical protein K1Y36_26170 [Blastocatellia bacterium]|nr:hypothetical protein [Blastocatellia bacterium]
MQKTWVDFSVRLLAGWQVGWVRSVFTFGYAAGQAVAVVWSVGFVLPLV